MRERAKAYRRLWPNAKLTPNALVTHWAQLATTNGNSASSRSSAPVEDFPPVCEDHAERGGRSEGAFASARILTYGNHIVYARHPPKVSGAFVHVTVPVDELPLPENSTDATVTLLGRCPARAIGSLFDPGKGSSPMNSSRGRFGYPRRRMIDTHCRQIP